MEVDLHEIERLEDKYLNKFFHFLKFAEDELLYGFATKEEIKRDWFPYWSKKSKKRGQRENSDFSTGAERIVYALFNGKGIGQPNSSPVGSDLFFEVEDAYIHIDLKTVRATNIGDYKRCIFVGENQNSYNHFMLVRKKERGYNPHLPHFYTKKNGEKKPCLTYFVTILHENENLDILMICILCMPNGALSNIYKEKPLKAGKTPRETRFNFKETPSFLLLPNEKRRIRLVYLNREAVLNNQKYQKELNFILEYCRADYN